VQTRNINADHYNRMTINKQLTP